jgi:diaminohydroxyphosphoribosylaminopyrimidine deaminase/5-amino-6-(5-phosphoribosylamino)uracil reductase
VTVGVLETEARRLAGAHFKRQATGLPLVIAKWAMTLDGRIATAAGESHWISSEESRRRAHEIRRISDAVLVGAGTARRDRPRLTVRSTDPLPERGQPTRVVLDETLTVEPADSPFAEAREVPVILYTTDEALETRRGRADALREAGCELVAVPYSLEGVSPEAVLADLGRRGMSRVLIEGGALVFGSFCAAGLVDRVAVFVAPKIMGGAGALGPVAGPDVAAIAEAFAVADMTVSRCGPDLLIEGRLGKF